MLSVSYAHASGENKWSECLLLDGIQIMPHAPSHMCEQNMGCVTVSSSISIHVSSRKARAGVITLLHICVMLVSERDTCTCAN